jgi:hypothetical protein
LPVQNAGYHAFLLRLRRCANGEKPVWRFSLERPGQPGLLLFSSVDELVRFLLALMDDEVAGQSQNQAGAQKD